MRASPILVVLSSLALLSACAHKAKVAEPPVATATLSTTSGPPPAPAVAERSCKADDDCATKQLCIRDRCVDITAELELAECTLVRVHFDFNESVLTSNAGDVLARNAACLKQSDHAAALEGHADPRGTEEYNLALSERRSLAVKKHLENLGVAGGKLRSSPKGKTESTGTNEAGWAKDRRVDLKWD